MGQYYLFVESPVFVAVHEHFKLIDTVSVYRFESLHELSYEGWKAWFDIRPQFAPVSIQDITDALQTCS